MMSLRRAGLGETVVKTLVKPRPKPGRGALLSAIEQLELRRLLSTTIQPEITGTPIIGTPPVTLALDEFPTTDPTADPSTTSVDDPPPEEEDGGPDRENLPQNADSPDVVSIGDDGTQGEFVPLTPQQVSTPNFLGATLADAGAFPPDSMGTVGPTQYIVAINGRIRSFNKTTGSADGALNMDTDVFFSSAMTPTSGTQVNFTSDPRIRYDRATGRWFVVMIDVPSSSSSSIGDLPNRIMIAVSNGGTITNSSNFTFYSFQGSATSFADYPTLGIDNNALYIGGNMFGFDGSFNTDAYVVKKSSV